MNQKTAKLLKRYASHVKSDPKEIKSLYRELKDEWDRLTADQRRKRRYAYSQAVKTEA